MTAHFELRRGKDGRYLFNLKAGNGEIILTSGIYDTREAVIAAIASVRASAGDDSLFERKTGRNEKPYFVLKSPAGDIVGKSEMYASTRGMEGGIDSVMRNAPAATLQDTTEEEAAPAHH